MSNAMIAEYYFDYRIEKVFGGEDVQTPRIYFERDCRNQALPYTLFTVPGEWLCRQDILDEIKDTNDAPKVRAAIARLPYDEICIVFDIKGISCAALSDPEGQGYAAAEIKYRKTFEQFYDDGCRIVIENQNSSDHSGVGVMEMKRAGETVAKFFFVVNFTFRKKIKYSLAVSGNKLSLTFRCKDRPEGIPVAVAYDPERFPCLKNDMGVNVVDSFPLDFGKRSVFKKTIRLREGMSDGYFSLSITDPSLERFYMLDCLENSSLHIRAQRTEYPAIDLTCPFCHQPISGKTALDSRYKRGGISCGALLRKEEGLPTIFGKNQSKLSRCMYCSKDLEGGVQPTFNTDFRRLLPEAFLEHEHFKIAFTGSTRTGKTTYISRFFELSGDKRVGMPMTMTQNSVKRFGIDVNSAFIGLLKKEERPESMTASYILSDESWTGSMVQYTDRSINLTPPRFPIPTSHRDYTMFPFITEVNRDTYVSFYDIAGEDAQNSVLIRNIANNGLIGIFLLVNGKSDKEANKRVIDNLVNSGLSPDSPIAVIVTKMDILEPLFDSNSHCLRTDYFDKMRTYEGSRLQREIDISSEEIRSYLQREGLVPEFGRRFTNIKYFGISSFNFLDSIHNEDEDLNAPGRVKFICSSKRTELPFVWMLSRFGIIR